MPQRRSTVASPEGGSVASAPPPEPFDFDRPNQKLPPDRFFEYCRLYPRPDGCALYIYRLWPVIDRKLVGIEEKYIDKLPGPTTQEELMREHGSGTYMLRWNDSNVPRGLAQRAYTNVEINHPDFPASVDPAELVRGNKKNESYIEGLKRRGLWKEDAEVEKENNAPFAQVMSKALDLVAQNNNKPEQKPPAADPVSSMLLNAFVALNGQYVHLLEKSSRASAVQPAHSPSADPFDVLTKSAETFKTLGWRPPGANSGSAGPAAPAVDWDKIGQWGAIIVGGLRDIVAMFVQGRNDAAMAGVPGTMPVPATPAMPAAPPPQQQRTTLQGASTAMTMRLMMVLSTVFPRGYQAFVTGLSGYDFAEQLDNDPNGGAEAYDTLYQAGIETFKEAMGMDPDLDSKLAAAGKTRAELEAWLEQFIDYGRPETQPEVAG
jgi:hypothetical protein